MDGEVPYEVQAAEYALDLGERESSATTCFVVHCDGLKMSDEEADWERMRKERLRENAIEWLRHADKIYIPKNFQGLFYTYKRTRARRRVR